MAGNGEPLDAGRIRASLEALGVSQLAELTVLAEADSTNDELTRLPLARRHAHAILADTQTGGRGRRQRSWYSPPGANIYLSLGWTLRGRGAVWSSVPLVSAVCLCRALDRAGLQGHGIKWPNDILVGGNKLAGILVESQAIGSELPTVVIGIGLNVHMPRREAGGLLPIDKPWTDLSSLLPAGSEWLDRNRLSGLLLDELLAGLARFDAEGWEAFRPEWEAHDLVSGRRIRLEGNGGFRAGRALGVDEQGGLWVDIDGYGVQALHSAEVSLRDD